MPAPPEASKHVARRASAQALARRDGRTPVTLTVRYRGGAEAWFEVRARGRIWRRPGWVALLDLMAEIYDGTGGKLPDR